MESAGLITRTRAANDERRVIVALTPAGKSLRRKAEKVPLAVTCATGCAFDDITRLTAQLQTLRANVAGSIAPDTP